METKLSELIARCRSENERFAREGVSDSTPCWEIWQRAVVTKDEEAWQAVMSQYEFTVRGWLRTRLRSIPWLRQEEDMLFNSTFIRFQRSVDSEKFKNFPGLAAILRYLQMCCYSAITDEQRDYQARSKQISLDASLTDNDDRFSSSQNNPISFLHSKENLEEAVADNSERLDLWKRLRKVVPDKKEQMLIQLYYVWEVAPRDIPKMYPQYFPTVEEVYRLRRNILARLRNNSELLRLP